MARSCPCYCALVIKPRTLPWPAHVKIQHHALRQLSGARHVLHTQARRLQNHRNAGQPACQPTPASLSQPFSYKHAYGVLIRTCSLGAWELKRQVALCSVDISARSG